MPCQGTATRKKYLTCLIIEAYLCFYSKFKKRIDTDQIFCYNSGSLEIVPAGPNQFVEGVFSMLGTILGLVIALVVAAVVLMIVSRFNLGLKVDGFASAIVAAIAIAVVGAVINWLLTDVFNMTLDAGLIGAIVYLIIAAVVLLIADRFIAGLKVAGFAGAIIAAIAIGVVYWIFYWLLGLLNIL